MEVVKIQFFLFKKTNHAGTGTKRVLADRNSCGFQVLYLFFRICTYTESKYVVGFLIFIC